MCMELCACMFFAVCKGVAFTITAVPEVCTAVFCAASCFYAKCVYRAIELRGEKFILVSQHPVRRSDGVRCPQRRVGLVSDFASADRC